jgi:hypothetical protein
MRRMLFILGIAALPLMADVVATAAQTSVVKRDPLSLNGPSVAPKPDAAPVAVEPAPAPTSGVPKSEPQPAATAAKPAPREAARTATETRKARPRTQVTRGIPAERDITVGSAVADDIVLDRGPTVIYRETVTPGSIIRTYRTLEPADESAVVIERAPRRRVITIGPD